MSRLIPDSRLISVENIDRTKSVLVDAHSLQTLANILVREEVPTFDQRLFWREKGGSTLANIIQTMVLYDTVLIDSLLYEINSDVVTADELFPGVIRGVFLRTPLRQKIGDLIEQSASIYVQRPKEITENNWAKWQLRESSEIQMMQQMAEVKPRLVPEDYINDNEIITFFDRDKPLTVSVPNCCCNSMMTEGRAHFYFEVAHYLGLPLSVDPERSPYFENIIQRYKNRKTDNIPSEIVQRFESKVIPDDPLITYDASIPAVAELVLRNAINRKISLYSSVTEIRESQNAVKFRDWCRRFQVYRQERPGAIIQRNMLRELDEVCEIWKKDVAELVDYQTRKIKLVDLPIIGKVLGAFGMGEILVKDPVLVPKKDIGYFLFLNDLLHEPKRSTA